MLAFNFSLYLSLLSFAWFSVAQTTSEESDASATPTETGTPTSTTYYAPVTITAPTECATKTAFAYINMERVTEHLDLVSTMTPWSTASYTTTSDGSSNPYIRVDLFLSEAPYSMAPYGIELAWRKACYDPRESACPTASPLSGPEPTTCMEAFAGAVIPTAAAVPVPTGAASSVRPSSRITALFGALSACLMGLFVL